MKHSSQYDLLSPQDLAFIPTLVKYLKTLKGVANAQNNRQIQAKFPKQFTGVSRSKLTAMIHEIRVLKLIPNLIGSPNGFYISRDQDRIKAYVETLHGHISARKESADSFGEEPGKGLKKRYKVKGFVTKDGKKIKTHYRTYPGFKNESQTKIDFEKPVEKNKLKKKPNYNQIKLF